eukprot:SAG31_NODE_17_length_35773_cov_25.999271_33_plen_152_part_00
MTLAIVSGQLTNHQVFPHLFGPPFCPMQSCGRTFPKSSSAEPPDDPSPRIISLCTSHFAADVPSVFNPGHAEQYGFIVDDFRWPRHSGTASFSIEGDPAWPNFLYGLTNDTYDPWDGIGNVSWTPKCDKMMNAGRRDGPLGPLCCRCGEIM